MELDEARDEMYEYSEDWTEYDERLLNEHWEMVIERDMFANLIPERIILEEAVFEEFERMVSEPSARGHWATEQETSDWLNGYGLNGIDAIETEHGLWVVES